MPPAVRERIRSDRAAWADRAAGAVVAEGVAVDQVAVEQVGLDTDTATVYGHLVGHAEIMDGLSEGHKSCPTSMTPLAEFDRLGFLRRVQYVDPRERRT